MLSASIVSGEPVLGAGLGAGAGVALASTLTAFMLKYCASETTLSTRLPALSATPCLPAHWKVVQLAVLGTGIEPLTFTPSTSMWKAAEVVWLLEARMARS